MNHPNEGLQEPFPVEDYLDLFDQAAYQIQGSPKSSITGRPRRPNIITGEQLGGNHTDFKYLSQGGRWKKKKKAASLTE